MLRKGKKIVSSFKQAAKILKTPDEAASAAFAIFATELNALVFGAMIGAFAGAVAGTAVQVAGFPAVSTQFDFQLLFSAAGALITMAQQVPVALAQAEYARVCARRDRYIFGYSLDA